MRIDRLSLNGTDVLSDKQRYSLRRTEYCFEASFCEYELISRMGFPPGNSVNIDISANVLDQEVPGVVIYRKQAAWQFTTGNEATAPNYAGQLSDLAFGDLAVRFDNGDENTGRIRYAYPLTNYAPQAATGIVATVDFLGALTAVEACIVSSPDADL